MPPASADRASSSREGGGRGSYDPRSTVGGLPGEIARLAAQAALTGSAEVDVLRSAGLRDGMSVVEVGCGTGAFLTVLANAFPGSRMVGLEPDPDLLPVAVEEVRCFGDRVTVEPGSIEVPPPSLDGAADAALARFVLQHVGDPVASVRSLAKLVVPGGLVAAVDVDGAMWGIASPSFPELSPLHARAWESQGDRGGDRFIGRKLFGYFVGADLVEVATRLAVVHSDDVGVEPFVPIIDPSELQPLVVDGVLTLSEYGRLVGGFEAFLRSPERFLLTVTFVTTGRRT